MKLLARADGGPETGYGHLMRTLALLETWVQQGGSAALATTSLPDSVRRGIDSLGVDILPIEASRGSEADARACTDLAIEYSADWVVIDGYPFGPGYQAALSDAGARILLLADHGTPTPSTVDLVLDQNLSAKMATYRRDGVARHLLLGPRYALLRKEFRDRISERPPVRKEFENLLVTLGGGEASKAIDHIVEIIRSLPQPPTTRVILPTTHELSDREDTNVVRYIVDPDSMSQHMSWADLAVIGGGSTAWEAAFMGLPMLVLALSPDQQPNADALAQHGAAVHIDTKGGPDADELRRRIVALQGAPGKLASMSRTCRGLVDGRGAERVVEQLWRYEI